MGYVLMQHIERLSRPVQAYRRWSDQIPGTYRESVLGKDAFPPDVTDCLGQLKHYRSLVPLAQFARKPIFQLTAADGAIGNHYYAVQEADTYFANLASILYSRMETLLAK